MIPPLSPGDLRGISDTLRRWWQGVDAFLRGLGTSARLNAERTLDSNSDEAVPTVKAARAYADAISAEADAAYQPLGADLTALDALTGTGFSARTASDTWALRSLSAPAAGFTITNPAGVAGNPTFALANDLAALEGLSGVGFPHRTGTDAWSIYSTNGLVAWTAFGPVAATITGTANEISVADGAGAGGAPTLSLPSALTFTGKTVTGGSFASPALTGTPTAPTAGGGTNTTQIATTAFVTSAISTAGAGYQPLDSDLTAIAALTTASYGRALLEATAATFGTLSGVINVNLLTNGAAEIAQRGTSFALSSGTKTKTLDMFHAYRNASNGVCERAAVGGGGSRYSIELRKNAGVSNNGISLYTQIESAVAAQLAGKTVYVSFWAWRGSSYDGNGIGLLIYTGTGTDETFTASTNSFVSTTTASGAGSSTGTLNTTPTLYSYAITIPSDCQELVVRWNVTQSSTTGDANHFVRLSNLHMGLNFAPAGFDREPIALTWSRCQRRYWKTFLEATAPAQNAGAGTGEHIAPATIAGANVNTLGTVRFPVPMRTAPTGVSYNPAASSAEARDLTNSVNCTATTIQNITTKAAEIIATGNAATTVGARLGVHLGFDAEFA